VTYQEATCVAVGILTLAMVASAAGMVAAAAGLSNIPAGVPLRERARWWLLVWGVIGISLVITFRGEVRAARITAYITWVEFAVGFIAFAALPGRKVR
jgi:hypothetical protein